MNLSDEIKLLGNIQIQRLLVELESDDLAILMTYHLDEDARNAFLANMSARGRTDLQAHTERARLTTKRVEQLVAKQIATADAGTSSGAILFTDLVNSTVRQNLLGDSEYFEQVITLHTEVVEESIRSNTGRIIKTIGDAYLATFTESWRGLFACDQLLRRFAELNREKPEEYHIVVRCALHRGSFAYRALRTGSVDIFGSDVNYAARLVSIAGGGEIWVSRMFAESLEHEAERLEELATQAEGHSEAANTAQAAIWEQFSGLYTPDRMESVGKFSFKGFEGDQEAFRFIRQ